MRQIGLKAVLRAQPARQRLQEAHRDLDLGTALPADEVAMAVRVREMPPRDAVFEMRVGHVPQLLERLQVPIHGRGIDLRMLGTDPRGDVVRGGVMLCALERFEHQAALDRHALAARADVLADLH